MEIVKEMRDIIEMIQEINLTETIDAEGGYCTDTREIVQTSGRLYRNQRDCTETRETLQKPERLYRNQEVCTDTKKTLQTPERLYRP